MAKNPSPITRSQFFGSADKPRKPLMVTISDGDVIVARAVMVAKNTGTGGFGYGSNGQTMLDIDGIPTPATLGCNLTVNGSALLDDAEKVATQVAKAKEAKAAARAVLAKK